MSDPTARDVADREAARDSKLERLLVALRQSGARVERREEARGQEPASRGLPPGFAFRRKMNH